MGENGCLVWKCCCGIMDIWGSNGGERGLGDEVLGV